MHTTREQRLTVLRNMGYEIDMLVGMQALRRSIRGLVVAGIDLTLAAGWNHNALLEAQCVHVRTLLEFFYVGRRRIRAASYVPDWKERRPVAKTVLGEAAGPLYSDLNSKLSHLNTPREEKRVWDALPIITEGLLHTIRLFETLLDADESEALRSEAPDIGWAERT